MKVSGFTFIRNAVKFDYPVTEAIRSVLPLCDEFVVALGNSEDETRELILSIGSPKIRIIDTVWDDSLREGGRVLAAETDKAFAAISSDSDWAVYIQGDEVIHEKYHPAILTAMQQWKDNPKVEGLLLRYLHFYGSYDYTGDSRKWYRREIRVVRNSKKVTSFRDAQGFRFDNRLMRVKAVDAWVYHYGWVKSPTAQQNKQQYFHKLWHDDSWMESNIPKVDEFDYSGIDSLARFTGTHPQVMHNRISGQNWEFSFDPLQKRFTLLSRILYWIEKTTGWRIGEYKNFRII
ncbi:MAG: glycosyltransferase family 2 protein [Bacteroidota bacterium]